MNETVPRHRFSRGAKTGYRAASKNQFTIATCLNITAIPVKAPASATNETRGLVFVAAARKATTEKMSGHNIKSSVFAAVPSTNGSALRSAKSAAPNQAQNGSTNRSPRKKSAHVEATTNSNPTR